MSNVIDLSRQSLEKAYANSSETYWEAFVVWMYLDTPMSWLIRLGQFLMGLGWAQPTHCAVLFKQVDENGEPTGKTVAIEISKESITISYDSHSVKDLWQITPDVDYFGTFENETIVQLLNETSALDSYTDLFAVVKYSLLLRWYQLMGFFCLYDTEVARDYTAAGELVSNVFWFVPPITCTFPIWRPMIIQLSKERGVPVLIPTAFSPAACRANVTNL